MELNDTVIQLLKNFAGINSSIVIDQGNELKTISEARNVLGLATIDQPFPKNFGIYDLNELLNVMSLVDSPRVRFDDNYMLIGDASGRSTIKYFYTDCDMLTKAPDKFNMPEPDVTFDLSNEVLSKIKRAASALGHSELAIQSADGCITLSVQDSDNNTSNSFSIDIPAEFDPSVEFTFICNISNLKLIPGDYEVKISSKLISHFTNTDNGVQYYIALEKSSKYGE
jgi:hypothetical protein